jgi:hypothetical protein
LGDKQAKLKQLANSELSSFQDQQKADAKRKIEQKKKEEQEKVKDKLKDKLKNLF